MEGIVLRKLAEIGLSIGPGVFVGKSAKAALEEMRWLVEYMP